MNDTNAQREMPKYKCHKVVHALKINSIRLDLNADHGIIFPEEPGFGSFQVENSYFQKHNPHPGGYFVVYEDGYKSFSPAEAFESGYTLIEE